jgi:hypothetical protein
MNVMEKSIRFSDFRFLMLSDLYSYTGQTSATFCGILF